MRNKQSDKKAIKLLLNALESRNLINSVGDLKSYFYDEPKIFMYTTRLGVLTDCFCSKDYYCFLSDFPSCGGISFTSKYKALLKCLGECAERICLYIYPKKSTLFSTFASLKKEALSPHFYIKNQKIKKSKLGWVKGLNYTKNIESLVPAQLIYFQYFHYLIYKKNQEEKILSYPTSNGVAGGTDRDCALLRGIYELIERDAAMTSYLTKAKVPLIDIQSLESRLIQKISKTCYNYNLNWFLFNITNDLGVPVFMSMLIDKTGLGPAVVVGTKADLDSKKAILGSIEEAFMGRIAVRSKIYKRKSSGITFSLKSINNQIYRLHVWSSPNSLKRVDYLFNQKAKPLKLTAFLKDKKKELETVKNLLKERKYQIYYVDITLDFFKKIKYFVYKIVIPGLQPLYLDERRKELKKERLRAVSQYFNKKNLVINNSPHF